jgi:hypothetical protein
MCGLQTKADKVKFLPIIQSKIFLPSKCVKDLFYVYKKEKMNKQMSIDLDKQK